METITGEYSQFLSPRAQHSYDLGCSLPIFFWLARLRLGYRQQFQYLNDSIRERSDGNYVKITN